MKNNSFRNTRIKRMCYILYVIVKVAKWLISASINNCLNNCYSLFSHDFQEHVKNYFNTLTFLLLELKPLLIIIKLNMTNKTDSVIIIAILLSNLYFISSRRVKRVVGGIEVPCGIKNCFY